MIYKLKIIIYIYHDIIIEIEVSYNKYYSISVLTHVGWLFPWNTKMSNTDSSTFITCFDNTVFMYFSHTYFILWCLFKDFSFFFNVLNMFSLFIFTTLDYSNILFACLSTSENKFLGSHFVSYLFLSIGRIQRPCSLFDYMSLPLHFHVIVNFYLFFVKKWVYYEVNIRIE